MSLKKQFGETSNLVDNNYGEKRSMIIKINHEVRVSTFIALVPFQPDR